MSKKFHDEAAALDRKINYSKDWFVEGIKRIDQLALTNFKLLDLGCGNGEFSEIAKERYNAEVTCLDYSENHLEVVRQKGFETIRCDFDSDQDVARVREEYQGKFDIIVSFEVIEHVFDTDAFLGTAYQLLKKGGWLMVSTPNYGYVSYRIYSMLRGNLPVSEGHHIRFFNQRRLRQVLLLNGFDTIQDYSFGKTDYYLDRTIGVPVENHKIRAFLVNAAFKLWHLFNQRGDTTVSNLLLLANKAAVPSLGLNAATRNHIYSDLSEEEKQLVIQHLSFAYRKGLFNEHAGLMQFLRREQQKIRL